MALALAGAPVGVFLILRRMSLTGDAMAHAILPGAAIGYLIAGLSLGAITLLMLLIRLGDVGRVASLIFLVPGVSALMAYVLFGETLMPVQILGMAVCAGAVIIVTRKWVRQP